MKAITRSICTQGMTDQERDAAIKAMWDEIEQERKRQEMAPILPRMDAMMQQITNTKG